MKIIHSFGPRRTSHLRHFTTAAFSLFALFSILLYPMADLAAAPSGGTVVGGSAAIVQNGATTTVNQGSNRAIINWRGFDIDVNELVKFSQPGAGAIALNRVTGGNPTSILGQLSANGRIFIVNPNGVVFGAGARVDVAGLLATTFDIRNDDFLSGRNSFAQDPNIDPAFVVNGGEIRIADNGFCFLVAPGVKNEGAIVAQLGKVVMASGNALKIDFNGDGMLTYTVSGKVIDQINGPDGKPLSSAVDNSGRITAAGGHVALVGNAAKEAFASVVNNSGIIEAASLVTSGGRVSLLGGTEGIVQNAGKIDVSAAEAAALPGQVSLSGQFAGNFGTILARGRQDAAGGEVTFDSTTHTLLGAESTIDVSGVGNASAGRVLLRSDNRSTFGGSVLARGGESGGDGGFVDVSSPGEVELLGRVDASAAHGRIGTLLIDPKNIDVNDTGAAYDPGNNNTFSNNAAGSTTIAASGPGGINNQIAGVVLQANNDITVTSAIAMTGPGTSLTMQAGRSVLVNNDIATTNGAIAITANAAAATLANRDAGAGNITVAAGKSILSGSAPTTLTIGTAGEAGGITTDTVTSTGTVSLNSAGSILSAGTGVISGTTVNLAVTGAAATVGSDATPLKINAVTLGNLSTGGGNAILEDTAGGVALGAVNVGGGAFALTATNGAITHSGGNVTAGSVILKTEGLNGGAIGTAGSPILTTTGILTASTNNGGVYVNETDGLLINSVIARESTDIIPGAEAGVAPSVSGDGKLVLVGKTLTRAGTFDVVVNAGGDVVVGTVTAPNTATVKTTSGRIIDNDPDTNNVTARTLNLQATGAIGLSTDAIEAIVETTSAATTDGSIYIALNNPGLLASAVAGGAGRDVVVSGMNGSLKLGTVTAQGTVKLTNDTGTLDDNNGATNNITAQRAELTARDGIGSSADPIEATVSELKTTTSTTLKKTYINKTGDLAKVEVKTNDGDVNIASSGGSGSLTFLITGSSPNEVAALNASVTSTASSSITFENTGGKDITLGTVDAGAGTATVTALAAIADDGNATTKLTAGTATLNAGGGIGSAASPLNTTVGTINAASASGDIYLRETDALTLQASTAGSGKNIDVQLASGDLTIKTVSTPGQIVLATPAGGIQTLTPGMRSLTGSGATLTAAGAIGTTAAPLMTDLGTLNATAGGGGLFFANSGALNLVSATATGDNLSVTAGGDLTLGSVTAAGKTVTLSASGQMIDGNGVANNITADTASLSAAKIGAAGAAIDTTVNTLTLASSSGGIYVDNTAANLNLPSAVSQGDGADIVVTNTGNISLGAITAKGDAVTLTSASGAITDGNGGAVNVTAKNLTITAPGGFGTDPLELSVDLLTADGGAAGGTLTNLIPLALTEAALEATGTGAMTFDAPSITLLDFADNEALVGANRNLTLRTPGKSIVSLGESLVTLAGNIVFLDVNDTIRTQGTGSITIDAGYATPGSGAVAIIGNLKTAGANIDLKADNHISIGELNAGTGNVSVISRSGLLLDGNGPALNVIANNLTLSGVTPNSDTAQQYAIKMMSDASAAVAEANSKDLNLQTFKTSTDTQKTGMNNAQTALNTAQSDVDAKQILADAAQKKADDANLAVNILNGVSNGLTIAATIVGTVAAVAQAVPFTGDGGSATAAFVITIAQNAVSLAAYIADLVAQDLGNKAADAAGNLDKAEEKMVSAQAHLDSATLTYKALEEGTSLARSSRDAAFIARDASYKVEAQAIAARTAANAIGTSLQPFGIQVPGRVDITTSNEASTALGTANASNIYLKTTGAAGLGGISASNTATNSKVYITGDGDLTVKGTISAQNLVRIDTTGGSILNGDGLVSAPEFAATATTGIGRSNSPLKTAVDRFAATGGSGGVSVTNKEGLPIGATNQQELTITAVDGLTGIVATGGVSSIKSEGSLTLKNPIDASTAGTVLLTSTQGALVDSNASAYDIRANGLGLTAATGIGAVDNPFETVVSNLAAVGGTGGVYLNNAGNLALQTVGALTDIGRATAISATGGKIALSTTGNLQIADGFVQGTGLTVDLTATGGSITEINPGAAADIVGATVNLAVTGAASTIGSGTETLEINATTLNASTAGGSIYLNDTAGGVALGLVTAGSGNVNLSAANGSITKSTLGTDPAAGVANIIGSTVNLAVTGAAGTIGESGRTLDIDATTLNASTAGGNLFLNDTAGGVAVGLVTAGSGNVNLSAANGSITEAGTDAAADIVGATVNLAVTGVASTIGSGTETLEVDATTLNASTAGGNVYLNDTAGGVAVGLVTAGSGNVNLSAANGSITKSALGSDPAAGVANIIGSAVELAVTGAASTIGDSGRTLDLNATTLNASTAGGGIFLNDTAGGVAVGLVTAGSGNVNLSAANGSITEAGTDTAADIVGNTVNLAVTGAASTIGSGTETLELNATTLNASTAGGNIYLNDTAGGVAVGLVTAVSGDVTLSAANGSIIEAGADAAADIVGNSITLAVTGVGSTIGTPANLLEVDASATTLNAATEGGGIHINDTTGGVAIGQITAGTPGGPVGDVILTATGGSIIPSGTVAGAGILGANVNLAVTGPDSTVGSSSAGRLNVNAAKLDVTTEGGDTFLKDAGNGGMGITLHYPTNLVSRDISNPLPNIMVQNNRIFGGEQIDKVFQSQTTLGPQQTFYASIDESAAGTAYRSRFHSMFDREMAPLVWEGSVFITRDGKRIELR